jgi:DNA-binding GntR family transcriptional regulator
MKLAGKPKSRSHSSKPRNRSLVASVYQSILERIVRGVLPSGTIVSELALANDLGVSRTPVHDAVRQLAKDGLVERTGRSRARVAHFGPDDLFEIFEMRKILEGPAAELAARRMDRRHFAPLHVAAQALSSMPPTSPDWTRRWADFDELFHQTIADASGNKRLVADINRYRLLHKGFNRISTDAESRQQALREHLEILDALEARDGALARRRMIEHITAWQDFFIQKLLRAAGPT